MKYLLSQSDIFSHFGAAKSLKQKQTNGDTAVADVNEELDEDEKAMAQEIEDDSGNETTTVLLKQPSIITGGNMRLVSRFNLISRSLSKRT